MRIWELLGTNLVLTLGPVIDNSAVLLGIASTTKCLLECFDQLGTCSISSVPNDLWIQGEGQEASVSSGFGLILKLQRRNPLELPTAPEEAYHAS